MPAISSRIAPFEFADLEMDLQKKYGAQEYCIIMRHGKTMILKLNLAIGAPYNFFPKEDIRQEIERLRNEKCWSEKKRRQNLFSNACIFEMSGDGRLPSKRELLTDYCIVFCGDTTTGLKRPIGAEGEGQARMKRELVDAQGNIGAL